MKSDYGLLKTIDRVLSSACSAINQVVEWIVGLTVLLIATVFFWEIGVRFLRIGSLRWALETNRILFITMGFLGSAAAYHRGRHVNFEYLQRKVKSSQAKSFLALITSVAALLFGVVLLKEGYASALTQVRAYLPALRISRMWLFVPIPISGFLFIVYATRDVLRSCIVLCEGHAGGPGGALRHENTGR